MDYRFAILGAVAFVLAAGCLGGGYGGPAANASDGGDARGTESATDATEAAVADGGGSDVEGTGSGVAPETTRQRSASDQYYLFVNDGSTDRRVSLYVLTSDVDELALDLANGTTVTESRSASALLRHDVTAVRPAGDVRWSETLTVEPGSAVRVDVRNASEAATVMRVSAATETAPDEVLSNVRVSTATAERTVTVEGDGSQRSVSGRPLADTEYANVTVTERWTVDVGTDRSVDG